MRIPFYNPVRTDVEAAPLTSSTRRAGRTTDILNPDTRYPIDHAVNTVEPHANAEEYRRAVRDAVAEMAAGAFDENNLEALSEQIRSWLPTWIPLVHRTATQRLEVAEVLLAQLVQSRAQVARELEALQERRAENSAVRRELLTQLGFSDEVRDPRPAVRPERIRPVSRIRALRSVDDTDTDTDDSTVEVPAAIATAPNPPLPFPAGTPPLPRAIPHAGFSASTDQPTS